MRALLDNGGDRGSVLSHFVGQLSPEDEDTLSHLLGQHHSDGTA